MKSFHSGYSVSRSQDESLSILKFSAQAIFNLEIKKKSGSSINPDIHHSKVPSSELGTSESRDYVSLEQKERIKH